MFGRISTALVLLSMPSVADSGLFQQIRGKDRVTLVVPNGECDAKVVARNLDRLTLKLKRTTAACGERDSLVVLSRTDVQDVVNNTRRANRPGESRAGFCAAAAMALVGAPSALAIAEGAGNGPVALLVLFAAALEEPCCAGKNILVIRSSPSGLSRRSPDMRLGESETSSDTAPEFSKPCAKVEMDATLRSHRRRHNRYLRGIRRSCG